MLIYNQFRKESMAMYPAALHVMYLKIQSNLLIKIVHLLHHLNHNNKVKDIKNPRLSNSN